LTRKHNLFFALFLLLICPETASGQDKDSRFVSFVTDPASISLYWKDDKGQIFRSIQSLKAFIEGRDQELRFAMNGGMYLKDNSPQGLYIENGMTHAPLDTLSGAGNFYLKPNGIFYITNGNQAVVCQTKDFINNDHVNFATQSGPMLIIDGQIHPAFKKGSANLNIRNGVGILPDNRVLFAMSRQEVNFHDFAEFFQKMGCRNALYLDGFVSRTYLPEENWQQLDGNFGVIIGVTK
jgi:uncharacterized protein YigE (DUF2233 family)